MCGEKRRGRHIRKNPKGSPPRVRGKVLFPVVVPVCCGITPACAGKSLRVSTLLPVGWDHPRVCGEKSRSRMCCTAIAGSPPRVRGKVSCTRPLVRTERITPACAGKSYGAQTPSGGYGDHPRVCGEKFALATLHWLMRGSPPRVRGKVRRLWTRSTRFRDHPRVCGEKLLTVCAAVDEIGSPPRVRGKD